MPVRIKARYEGFRRCGVAHRLEPIVHPDGRFTEEELEILEAEPMLTVEYMPESEETDQHDPDQGIPADPERMTVAQLREALPDAPAGALKPALVELYHVEYDPDN